ncbi:MAG: hypothetical protein A2621_01680 [Alphaproteobacteria bacterium RIFCSPHIGHO2_01_FULL_41_14]|nr:MAG: hypothetical protein A2065_02765 [Alphaproteobacteria bacterium GWB1_45_5]OFW89606.1 MAG: hypothetical protein A2621_01680 [Alphaproteobacteria bacterium RIFCSPHIGHO2_01_FULL_41_14]HCI49039.1 hypothetical protein [Holosporales bacterium]
MKQNEPILKIVKRSLSFTFKNIIPFLKCWAVPFLVSSIFYALSSYYLTSTHWFVSAIVAIVSVAINLVAASVWVPKWINFYESPKKGIKIFAFEETNKEYLQRSTVFLVGVALLLFFGVGISTLVGHYSSIFGSVIACVSMAAVFYISYRFSFILPAAALGEKITFMDSWRQSRGFSWKFLAVVLTLTFLINLPFILMGLFSILMYQIKIGMGIFGPFTLPGTLLMVFANILLFGAFTVAWTDFYKMIRKK